MSGTAGRMPSRHRRLRGGLVLLLVLGSNAGCRNDDCEKATEVMRDFILDEANQVCSSDADCATPGIGCAEIDFAFCGQVGLNRTAASSRAWRVLVEEASCEDSCSQCAAALIVSCTDGLCLAPRATPGAN